MIDSAFERISTLEYLLKSKEAIIASYENGERYVRMQEDYLNNLRHLEKHVKKLEAELASAYRMNTSMRNHWMRITDTAILNKVNTGDRIIIRDYINRWIIAADTVENLLDKSKYNQHFEVYKIGIENGCLLLEVCED